MAQEETAANLYPIALDLRGRRCVVVGAGALAARKAEGLLSAGVDLLVVAPEISGGVRELAAGNRVTILEAAFMPAHLDNSFLVLAATDSAAVNRAVSDAALERRVLCNWCGARAGESESEESGDFVTMASVRRGELLLALTTGGAGPALTARLRRELESRFGREWEPYVALLRAMRWRAKAEIADSARRANALRRLAENEGVLEAVRAGDLDGARREALACLS